MVLDKIGGDVANYQNSKKVMVVVKGRMSYCTVMGKILLAVQ